MASIEEVWGSAFPKKQQTMASKYGAREEPRDAEKEGRVHPTPIHRTAASMQQHSKAISDLSKSLPIAQSDEDAEANYMPARVASSGATEHMTNFFATKAGSSQKWVNPDAGLEFAYAPPSFQNDANEIKLNRILRMVEQNRTGYETPSSHDMMLYIFTGVLFLFTFDTFVNLGRRMK
jgi:hypothetical protein